MVEQTTKKADAHGASAFFMHGDQSWHRPAVMMAME